MFSNQTRKNMDKGIVFKIRPEIIICLFLILSTGAVYLQVWNHEFVGYDDDGYVSENVRMQNGLTLDNIIWAFKTTHKSNWHPLTWLSHLLDVQLFGIQSGRHHMTSLFFHILNSLLLFVVFRKMTRKVWQSGFVAVMFALHPLHVESVAWVSERKDVLSMFFWMLALWSYVRYTEHPQIKRYLAVIGFFVMGLMAKPMVVTLPFVLLLLDYWPLKRIQFKTLNNDPAVPAGRPSAGFLILEKAPLFIFALASCFITVFAQKKNGAIGSSEIHPFSGRVANALVSYLEYIRKMIWPDNLAVLYPYPGAISGWQFIAALILLIGISFLAIRYLKKFPWLGVGWFWYLGTLFPVIGIVQVGVQALADRYTYIPLTGLFIIFAWGTPQLMAGWRHRVIVISATCAALFPVLMITAWTQVSYWQNSRTLFTHTLNVTSNNFVIHNNLGYELAIMGRADDALKHYREAIRINPDFEMTYINLGKVLLLKGKVNESVRYYQALLEIKPAYAGVHHNLGLVLLRKGDTENAIVHFREALRINKNYAEVYNSLGAAMLSRGEINKAISQFRQALRIKPDLLVARKNLSKLENLADPKREVRLEFK
jgi:tetratricopeptide (TPR) repeat protein